VGLVAAAASRRPTALLGSAPHYAAFTELTRNFAHFNQLKFKSYILYMFLEIESFSSKDKYVKLNFFSAFRDKKAKIW